MTPEIRDHLLSLEQALWDAPRHPIPADRIWKVDVPARGGVYAFWHGNQPTYVGETCHLRHRLNDLIHGKHGFLLRPILLSTDTLAANYRVSFICDCIGRKELEDFLNVRWLGSGSKRLKLSEDFNAMRDTPSPFMPLLQQEPQR